MANFINSNNSNSGVIKITLKGLTFNSNAHYIIDDASEYTESKYIPGCTTHTVDIDAWRYDEHMGRCKRCDAVVMFKWSLGDVFSLVKEAQSSSPDTDKIMSEYQKLKRNIEAQKTVLKIYNSALGIAEAKIRALLSLEGCYDESSDQEE